MRLWSLHPRFLDAKGLVALWREGLLARKVLQGATKGYQHHPQLQRFRDCAEPLSCIDFYLGQVLVDATARHYNFDAQKIQPPKTHAPIPVSAGQLDYEWRHLRAKLERRAPQHLAKLLAAQKVSTGQPQLSPHPLFVVVPGEIASWERPLGQKATP